MSNKLTIAALAAVLILSIGLARAESCDWLTPQSLCAASAEIRAAHARHGYRPMTDRARCFAAAPELRDGCDKRYEAEDAQKRATGDLPQNNWRIAPPGNDWKVSR